ncbi:MAG: NAD(P)-binding protein [Bacillus sp. (in: Bacteria)]|nr:NAD(P)-binding protein [Bacillus sp. (in: firmicutes)]
MKIGVVGGGAIGLLCCYYLHRQGHSVTLVTKSKEQRDRIVKDGFFVLTKGEQHHCKLSVILTEEAEGISVDLWIAAMKQTGMEDFINRWQGLKSDTPILFLQNGMGHLEQGEKLGVPIYAGVVTHGAMRKNENTVKHTGVGCIFVGSWSEGDPTLLHQW